MSKYSSFSFLVTKPRFLLSGDSTFTAATDKEFSDLNKESYNTPGYRGKKGRLFWTSPLAKMVFLETPWPGRQSAALRKQSEQRGAQHGHSGQRWVPHLGYFFHPPPI